MSTASVGGPACGAWVALVFAAGAAGIVCKATAPSDSRYDRPLLRPRDSFRKSPDCADDAIRRGRPAERTRGDVVLGDNALDARDQFPHRAEGPAADRPLRDDPDQRST
jgi:hypothetical protein